MVDFEVNGQRASVAVDPETPLLWVLREDLGLTGTKYGCGITQCGACTVHADGEAKRCCMLPVGEVAGRKVTTIEGLGARGLHPVQTLWLKHQVPQCGYCQSGMIMAAAAMLAANAHPGDDELLASMTNICRCGTHARVRAALDEARGATVKAA